MSELSNLEKPILAIDPGTRDSLGYAVMDGALLHECGVLEGKLSPVNGVQYQLYNIVQKHRVKTIVIEDFTYWYNEEKSSKSKSNMGSVYVALKMKELIGFLLGFFGAFQIPIHKVQPRWWRARITDLDAVSEMYEDIIATLNYTKSKQSHVMSAIAIAMACQGFVTKDNENQSYSQKSSPKKRSYTTSSYGKNYRRKNYSGTATRRTKRTYRRRKS